MTLRTRYLPLLLFVLTAAAHSHAQHRIPSGNDTLAVVGDHVITTDEFTRLYREKLLRLGLNDNGDTRSGYLHNLVEDEVLIAQARNMNLHRTREALKESNRIRLQELLNAYAERHVSPHVTVTDGDLRECFRRMNTKVKVRHLFARTRGEADSIVAELSRGRTFDDLAREVFTDPHLRESGGSLGYISFDEMDPAFERAMYAMKPGDVSGPVKTVQGYSIIRVDDVQGNPFMTESEFAGRREKIRGFVHKQKCEAAAANLVAALREQLRVRFNAPLMNRLFVLTQQKSLKYLIENKSPALSASDLNLTAVTSASGRWSVSAVIDALSELPEGQRRWIRSRENLEDVLSGLVVRRFIAGKSIDERLDSAPAFQEKTKKSFDSYLLATLESQLRGEIRIPPDSVESYYRHNSDRFTTEPEIRLSGILLDNAGAADSVHNLLARGANFSSLARQFSRQGATAEYGGDLGYFTRGQLRGLGAQLFALRRGEWTGPLVQEGKQLFVKCTDVRGPAVRSLQESSQEIKKVLVAIAWETARSRYVESARKSVGCRIYPVKLMELSFSE